MVSEERIADLEYHVYQQQGQLEYLNALVKDLGARLRCDLETLRGEHSLLREESRALGECLVGANVVQVSKVRLRTQECWAFSLLRSAVSNGRVSLAISALADGEGLGIARLALTSRTLGSLRRKVSAWRAQGGWQDREAARKTGKAMAALRKAGAAAAAERAQAAATASPASEAVDVSPASEAVEGLDLEVEPLLDEKPWASPASEAVDVSPASEAVARPDLEVEPVLDEKPWRRLLVESAPASGAVVLEDEKPRWRLPIENEPSEAALKKWERSVAVKEILGSYVVEDTVGGRNAMKFDDVHAVFHDMGLSLREFVKHFSVEAPAISGHHADREVKEMANSVLRMFVKGYVEESGSICFCDLYRLLEIIGYPLSRFCSKFTDRNPEDSGPLHCGKRPQLGSYRIVREIGGGARGMCCYLAEHTQGSARAAVKWPVPRGELSVLKAIHRHSGGRCLGVARLLDTGIFEGQNYMVTELLGSPFQKVFSRLHQTLPALEQRWDAISLLGRMLVRRLQALHECGYVHCDISPENILLGHTAPSSPGGRPRFAPFLVDFGLARRYPGGGPLGGEFGSAEWNSIRSADDGERKPEDDLESLGWVMVTGLFGTLPWVEWLSHAYTDWGSRQTRNSAIKQVQQAKLQLLEEGWDSLGWPQLAQVPSQLDNYIRECRLASSNAGPDYSFLLALLGCNPDLSVEEAEEEDLVLFGETVAPLL